MRPRTPGPKPDPDRRGDWRAHLAASSNGRSVLRPSLATSSTRRRVVSRATVWLSLLVPLVATVASAQSEPTAHDEEARSVFQAGTLAFDDARYEDALGYFQRAFELSQRPVLLYNIGVAADRLRRDELALESFERFLADVPEHPRRRDVLARVEVLREAVAQGRAARESELPRPEVDVETETEGVAPEAPPRRQRSALSIVGPVTLGALGLAGVVAGVVGIAAGDRCVLENGGGVCLQRRDTDWGGVGLWGGLGLAALTAGIVWLVVGLRGSDDGSLSLGPNGELSWQF